MSDELITDSLTYKLMNAEKIIKELETMLKSSTKCTCLNAYACELFKCKELELKK